MFTFVTGLFLENEVGRCDAGTAIAVQRFKGKDSMIWAPALLMFPSCVARTNLLVMICLLAHAGVRIARYGGEEATLHVSCNVFPMIPPCHMNLSTGHGFMLQAAYCQGMAFVAGLLLFYVPEEPAFQLFCRLLRYGVPQHLAMFCRTCPLLIAAPPPPLPHRLAAAPAGPTCVVCICQGWRA